MARGGRGCPLGGAQDPCLSSVLRAEHGHQGSSGQLATANVRKMKSARSGGQDSHGFRVLPAGTTGDREGNALRGMRCFQPGILSTNTAV